MNIEVEISMLKAKVKYLEDMLEATINKISDQPERSKREDSTNNNVEMRCSELCGDTERLAEKISPPLGILNNSVWS